MKSCYEYHYRLQSVHPNIYMYLKHNSAIYTCTCALHIPSIVVFTPCNELRWWRDGKEDGVRREDVP